ncbi:ribosomal RNA-processing protein 7-domain-containing protein [Coprinopsis sp. MPI-PUGE-AT-0042]|nr:ribosomal RNA-processing protein 7-domain-containing protein [Coprinopsis sp. MPI-PUGE-AT-0042]
MGTPCVKANGFSALPIAYSKFTTHYVYAHTHVASAKNDANKRQDQSLPNERTVFLVNVRPDARECELVKFFKPCGTVEKVVLDSDVKDSQDDDEDSDEEDVVEDEEIDTEGGVGTSRRKRKVVKDEPPKVAELPSKPQQTIQRTGLTAYVVFLDQSSLSRALALASSPKPRPWPTSNEETSGLAHSLIVYQHQQPHLDSIREHVDTYMELFEYKAAKERQKSKYRKAEAIVDEDDFTLVTRGDAYGKRLGDGVSVATKQYQRSGATSSRARPKKKKGKGGFYAFQKAEKQLSELLNLKKRWEEDKAKLEKLRASRRFKPH